MVAGRKEAQCVFFATFRVIESDKEVKRMNKLSDDQFIHSGICVEASQIPLIAEQNLIFCSRSSA